MKSSATLRRGRAGDAAGILALEQHFPSDRMSLRSVRNFLAAPSAAVWVVPGQAAGSIDACLILLTRRGSGIARVYSVVVGPAARGRGLAVALVRAAEHWALRHGSRCMSLEVRMDNAAARALYAKLGYAEHAQLPGFYDDGAPGVRLRRYFRPIE